MTGTVLMVKKLTVISSSDNASAQNSKPSRRKETALRTEKNDMNIAFQVYSQVETQLQVARAKAQEAKLIFAIVEPASVPLSLSSPNKPLIIIAFIFLGFTGNSLWIEKIYKIIYVPTRTTNEIKTIWNNYINSIEPS